MLSNSRNDMSSHLSRLSMGVTSLQVGMPAVWDAEPLAEPALVDDL